MLLEQLHTTRADNAVLQPPWSSLGAGDACTNSLHSIHNNNNAMPAAKRRRHCRPHSSLTSLGFAPNYQDPLGVGGGVRGLPPWTATTTATASSTALYAMRNPFHFAASAAAPSTAVASVATAAASTITTTATSAAALSFLKLFLVFIAGGLFFSSAMAYCTACYAVGTDNVKRFGAMAEVLWENIWMTFTMGLDAARATLIGEYYGDEGYDYYPYHQNRRQKQSWRWKDAWRVLKIKLRETRQKAVEGVEAIRKEAKMYAAAVGPPGLIPLQYVLDRIMPYSIAGAVEDSLKGALEAMMTGDLASYGIQRLDMSHFEGGTQAPKLESARVYDMGENAMAFDFDVTWDSEMEATIQVYTVGGLARFPVTLKNAKIQGTVRVVLTPLTKEAPGFGATLVSFPSMPEIGLDIRVAGGEVTKVLPRLRSELIASIQNSIANSMVWPKRVVFPSLGMTDKPIMARHELKKLETTDPLLEAEEALGTRPMLRRKLNQMSNVLYQDNAADDELLKSVVNLPMPSFERPIEHQKSVTKAQHGFMWDHLEKAHTSVQEKVEEATKEAKILQDLVWEQLQLLKVQSENSLKKKAKEFQGPRKRQPGRASPLF